MEQRLYERYDLMEPLGKGGAGQVYHAYDTHEETDVAIKFLHHDHIKANDEINNRFRQEGEILHKLNHPNIVRYLDEFEVDGTRYIVMEYVPTGTLQQLLRRHDEPLSFQIILKIAIELSDALTRAHYYKVLHRDIKPANIMLTDNFTPRLIDFGLAQLQKREPEKSGALLGTFAYLSPEGCQGDELDFRSDIWAFGVVLFEMITGQRPFEADQSLKTLELILTNAVPDIKAIRPDTPDALADLVYRMLEKNKQARIPSMRLVGAELENILYELEGIDDLTFQSLSDITSHGAPKISVMDSDDLPTVTPLTSGKINKPNHNLPGLPTSFIGRERELQHITDDLQDDNQRLITLIGVGGVGKTRLAIAAGYENVSHFRDGVAFVDLAPLNSETEILSALLNGLDFSPHNEDNLFDEILNYLSNKEMLIIFDNFEHVINSAEIINQILRQAPQCKIIVTSRERLKLQGETLLDVASMDLPTRETPLDVMLDYPIVQIFLEQAQQNIVNFALTEENAPWVVEVCQTLDGLPLGVELAAGWLEMLTVREISSEIKANLNFLESNHVDRPERHTSLHAAFDYSWQLLDDEQRDLLLKCTIFEGSFTRDAAAKVTDASLKTLMKLVNKSFLKRTPDGRFSIQRLLKQFAEDIAREELSQEKRDEIAQVHAKYYAKILKREAHNLSTYRAVDALDDLIKDISNIMSAWNWFSNQQNWHALDLMLHPLSLYFRTTSRFQSGAAKLMNLANSVSVRSDIEERIYWRANLRYAWLMVGLGKFRTIESMITDCYRYFNKKRDGYETILAGSILTRTHLYNGDHRSAQTVAQDLADLIEDAYDDEAIYLVNDTLGAVKIHLGEWQAAYDIYMDLLQIAEEKRLSMSNKAHIHNQLGQILKNLAKSTEAITHFENAIKIARAIQSKNDIAEAQHQYAKMQVIVGNIEEARKIYEHNFDLYNYLGNMRGVVKSISAMGYIDVYENVIDAAQTKFEECLAVSRRHHDLAGEASSLEDIGFLHLVNGQHDDAITCYQDSFEIREHIGHIPSKINTMIMCGYAARTGQQWQLAEDMLHEALDLSQSMNQDISCIQTSIELGRLYIQLGSLEKAERYIDAASKAAKKAKALNWLTYALATKAILRDTQQRRSDTIQLLCGVLDSRYVVVDIGQKIPVDIVAEINEHLASDLIRDATLTPKDEQQDIIVIEEMLIEPPETQLGDMHSIYSNGHNQDARYLFNN